MYCEYYTKYMYPLYYLQFPNLHLNTSAAIPVHHQRPGRLPNVTKPSLLEPSFADALSAIDQSTELSPQTRSQWASALRQIAKALDKPMETLPARLTAMRFNLERLHHATVGANAKTLANQKSNVKAALRWFGREHEVAPRGMPLTTAWATLRDSIGDYGRKARLSGFMRYCSGCGIDPAAVNENALDQYFVYRKQTTSLATNLAARRSVARAWNVCVGHSAVWPQRKLTEPALQVADGPAWNDFPPGLKKDIDDYLASLQKIRKATNGKRYRPCSATTIRTRRAELVAMVRKAVRIGIPIERFTSLTALVHPDVAGPVLDAYWRDNGDEPKIFTIELASKLVGLGRYLSLDQDAIDRLEDLRATLEEHRQGGLTEKNLAVVRKVLTPGVWRSVVNLPAQLMRDARASLPYAPIKAALTAQIAVAISILCFAPIRLGNLVAIRIDQNLIKPGGPNRLLKKA